MSEVVVIPSELLDENRFGTAFVMFVIRFYKLVSSHGGTMNISIHEISRKCGTAYSSGRKYYHILLSGKYIKHNGNDSISLIYKKPKSKNNRVVTVTTQSTDTQRDKWLSQPKDNESITTQSTDNEAVTRQAQPIEVKKCSEEEKSELVTITTQSIDTQHVKWLSQPSDQSSQHQAVTTKGSDNEAFRSKAQPLDKVTELDLFSPKPPLITKNNILYNNLDNNNSHCNVSLVTQCPPTPQTEKKQKKQKLSMEERAKNFYQSIVPYVDKYGKEICREFYDYWTEPYQSGFDKMRFEGEKTWSVGRRLATWKRNKIQYEKRTTYQQPISRDMQRAEEKAARQTATAERIAQRQAERRARMQMLEGKILQ